ncbi:hypothetical protein B0H12DRAFT_1109694 [Mycena haematopus]|nr:hypothetical protein B0H12DRAFT_1109694 [Mycena haematopus]
MSAARASIRPGTLGILCHPLLPFCPFSLDSREQTSAKRSTSPRWRKRTKTLTRAQTRPTKMTGARDILERKNRRTTRMFARRTHSLGLFASAFRADT